MSTKTMNILIADQSSENRLIYKRLLGGRLSGYRFVECEQGEQVLDTIRVFPFDCVLVDFDLPDMDGVELIEELQLLESVKDVPIVFLTEIGNDDAAAEALKAGAAAFFFKGQFDGDDLKQAIENAIANPKSDPVQDLVTDGDTDDEIDDIREMTGALCEELTRPLQIISGQVEMRRRLYAKSYDQNELMQKILTQTKRLEGLSRKLKSLTRYEVKEFPCDLKGGDLKKGSIPSKFQ